MSDAVQQKLTESSYKKIKSPFRFGGVKIPTYAPSDEPDIRFDGVRLDSEIAPEVEEQYICAVEGETTRVVRLIVVQESVDTESDDEIYLIVYGDGLRIIREKLFDCSIKANVKANGYLTPSK